MSEAPASCQKQLLVLKNDQFSVYAMPGGSQAEPYSQPGIDRDMDQQACCCCCQRRYIHSKIDALSHVGQASFTGNCRRLLNRVCSPVKITNLAEQLVF